MTPVVLGLDPSLVRAGIAAVARTEPASMALRTDVGWDGEDAADYPERRTRIRTQMHSIVRIVQRLRATHDITLAVIEGPIYGCRGYGQYFDRAILWGGVCDWLDVQGIPIAVVSPSSREEFITGVGSKGDKPRCLAEMRALWCPANPRQIANHDQADALGLATAGAIHLGWRMPFIPQRRHVENVARVTWPDIPQAS